jgi:hypothetical protein
MPAVDGCLEGFLVVDSCLRQLMVAFKIDVFVCFKKDYNVKRLQ